MKTREDALTRRIRRFVKAMKWDEDRKEVTLPCLRYTLYGRGFFARCFFFFLFFIFVMICLYQLYGMIIYYRTYPVVVDILIKEREKTYPPKLAACSLMTEKLEALLNENRTSPGLSVCSALLNFFEMDNIPRRPMKEIWDLLNDTNIRLSGEIPKGLDIPPTIFKRKSFNQALGNCKSIYSTVPIPKGGKDFRLYFTADPGKYCQANYIAYFLNPFHEETDLSNIFAVSMGDNVESVVSFKEYTFLNTPSKPCFTHERFMNCRKKCHADELERLVQCRPPYNEDMDPSLPYCKTGESNKTLMIFLHEIFKKAVGNQCGCLRRCQVTLLEISNQILGVKQPTLMVSLRFENNYITYIRERPAYTLLSLICDFGGNIGLYTGLSLLAFVELFQTLFHFSKPNSNPRLMRDPIRRKVYRIFKVEMERWRSLNPVDNLDFIELVMYQKRAIGKAIWGIIVFLCALLSGYLIYSRVLYYWSVPVTTLMSVVENETVYYPNLTVCGMTSLYNGKLKNFLKSHPGFSPENATLIDVMYPDSEKPAKRKINSLKTWKSTNLALNFIFKKDKTDHTKSPLAKIMHSPKAVGYVGLPDGVCVEYFVGEQEYSGQFSKFISAFKKVTNNVGDDRIKVYITPQDELLDISSFHYIQNGHFNGLFLTTKEIKRISTSKRPCSDAETSRRCRKDCLEKLLLSRISCRLMYMPENNLTRDCLNATEAHEAESIFIEIYRQPNICNCPKPCHQTIFQAEVVVQKDYVITTFSVTFRSNYFEKVEEVISYTFLKLLCDIGNILGLTLGICVLALLDSFFLLFSRRPKSGIDASKVRVKYKRAKINL